MQQRLSAPRSVVVVIDDDPAVRNSLKFSLEIDGFVVHLYESGSALLEGRDIQDCDCLVIDQKMPGMSGLDLIARLRALAIRTPAILITSHPSADVVRRAAGAHVSIVEKPLLGNTLIERIRDACAKPANRHC